MKRLVLILILALIAVRAVPQCVSVRSATTICQGGSLTSLGGKMLKGTKTILWSDNGANGIFTPDATTLNATWTPAPAFSGIATLTLTSTAGCTTSVISASFSVTVNPLPTATISYSGSPYCKSTTGAQAVTRTGTAGGKYSSTSGLTINATSGAITPSTSTAGTYTVSYTMAASGTCPAVTATTTVAIVAIPSAPVVGVITQPTCLISTGSVALSGLPATGEWTINSSPAGTTMTGTGTTATVSGIPSGVYTFRVTFAGNCPSPYSGLAVINSAPIVPAAPVIGTITQPTCSVSTGSVALSNLPSTGTWTLTRSPGNVTTTGTGTSTTISAVPPGTFTFTVTNSSGCTSPSSPNAVINAQGTPDPPVVGAITQPTCVISTGSVIMNGLPPSGNWTLTRNPGATTISGTGTSITVSTLMSGTYTFTVTNSFGCVSVPSTPVIINEQPTMPNSPAIGTITPPTCATPTGSVLLSGLPATGTWTLIRYPGTISVTGTGTSVTIGELVPGIYNFTVSNSGGCLSVPSQNVIIASPPSAPAAPVISTVTQPTLTVLTGTVTLTSLPGPGSWTIRTLPGGVATTGTGSSAIIPELSPGTYTFSVTNAAGCTSTESVPVTISRPDDPQIIITNPQPVCYPATVNLTKAEITAGSTTNLTYTYWTDSKATVPYNIPAAATAGTYYIKGTNPSGFFSIKPVVVTVDRSPVPNAGPDQVLEYLFSTILDASLGINQTGLWSVLSGSAKVENTADPKSSVSSLSIGDNRLIWSIKEGVCPAVADTVNIIVHNLKNPTLITPNMDGKNDYFIVRGLSTMGKTEITVFDRRGVNVFRDSNYENQWNGVDYNEKPLPDDTYFYVLKTQDGKSLTGYIVIRR